MPPPAVPTRGRARGRAGRGNTESHARRYVARGDPTRSSIADFSVAPRSTPYSDALERDDHTPHTPQSADATQRVYGSSYPDALPLTPRTQNATANLMNKFIDRLFASSKDLLSHFSIDVQDRDEAWVYELRTHKEVFHQYYKIYTMEAAPFIDIDAVSDRTKSSDNQAVWQRMTLTVATANLANLLSDVEDLDSDPNVLNRLPFLEGIDDHFPLIFIPGGNDGLESHSWLMDSATIEQAFTIRTHRFIETLRAYPKMHPLRLLAKVFLAMDLDSMTDDELELRIHEAGYRPFIGFDIDAPEMLQYRDRISGFRNVLAQMQTDAVVDKLGGGGGEYHFELFLTRTKDWIRTVESALPGPHRPLAILAYDRDPPYSPGAQLQAEAGNSRYVESGVLALKQRSSGVAQQGQESPHFLGEDTSYQSFDEASLTGTQLDIHNLSREQAAMRVSDNAGSAYAAAAAQTVNGGGGRKRGRKNTGDGSSHAKRVREATTMPAPTPMINPDAPVGPAPAVFDPLALSQAAQLISKANRRPPATPKARRPWTVHDTQQLVTAIDVYKAKWSTIEKAIKGHHIAFNVIERDQQGLRDKARLVKVDILKTDSPLPPSFDLVVLGKKEKDMVISAGKNPYRREADVDAAGHPINTLYDENAQQPPPSSSAAQVQQAPEIAAPEAVEASEMDDLRPLQEEAQMAMDTHMRSTAGAGAPDAPMMTADMDEHQTQVSESLGEPMSVDEANDAPPIDPNMMPAGPGSEVAPV
ncbi:unnamed protein product [Discula destructiva]